MNSLMINENCTIQAGDRFVHYGVPVEVVSIDPQMTVDELLSMESAEWVRRAGWTEDEIQEWLDDRGAHIRYAGQGVAGSMTENCFRDELASRLIELEEATDMTDRPLKDQPLIVMDDADWNELYRRVTLAAENNEVLRDYRNTMAARTLRDVLGMMDGMRKDKAYRNKPLKPVKED